MAFSVEAALVGWLGELGYEAHADPPAERPDRFVSLERVGGGSSDLIDNPSVAVLFWNTTRATAMSDAEGFASAALLASRDGTLPDGVYALSVDSGPYMFNDPDSGVYRYQVVLDLTCAI